MKHNQTTIDLIKSTRTLYNSITVDFKNTEVIGWEHVLNKRSNISICDQSTADKMLVKDLNAIDRHLNKLITVTINQNKYNAIVSLVYSIGISKFKYSEFLLHLNNHDFIKACGSIRQWNKLYGKSYYYLAKLRKMEVQLFNS